MQVDATSGSRYVQNDVRLNLGKYCAWRQCAVSCRFVSCRVVSFRVVSCCAGVTDLCAALNCATIACIALCLCVSV